MSVCIILTFVPLGPESADPLSLADFSGMSLTFDFLSL